MVTRFVICGDTFYRRSADDILLLCLDRDSVDRMMIEVHARVYGPHMEGHMLARKIMRTGYYYGDKLLSVCLEMPRVLDSW